MADSHCKCVAILAHVAAVDCESADPLGLARRVRLSAPSSYSSLILGLKNHFIRGGVVKPNPTSSKHQLLIGKHLKAVPASKFLQIPSKMASKINPTAINFQ